MHRYICAIKKYDKLKSGDPYLIELLQNFDNERDKSSIQDLINLIMNKTKHASQIFELFGCYRHFGHPIVNELAGIDDLQSTTRKDIAIDEEIASQVSGAFNRLFISSFLAKHKRWPKCTISDERTKTVQVSQEFRQLIDMKPVSLSRYDSESKIETLEYIGL